MAYLGIIKVKYKVHDPSFKPSDELITSLHHCYPYKSYNNCMSLPQSPHSLTSRTCNPNFPLVSLDHIVLMIQRCVLFIHRYLILTGFILTPLFSEVLFFLVLPCHNRKKERKKKSPMEVPWGTGMNIARSQGNSGLDLPLTLHCWTLDKVPLSVKWCWAGCCQEPF